MRLPDFLIIGAMKAGTTSLYSDLMTNPAVFAPYHKEPHALIRDSTLTDKGRRAYAKLFERATPQQVCGEASTGYSKLPDIPGVPKRAREVLGADLKVVYLVREPTARIISHHEHEWASGANRDPIDDAIRADPKYINYSLYAMQITPWIEMFGPDQVLIIRFETYIRNRQETICEVCRFLGVEPRSDLVRADVVYNRSEGKPVPRGPFQLLRQRAVYKKVLRPILSPNLRNRLREALLPKASGQPGPPSLEAVQYIVDNVGADVERLRVIMGQPQAPWDLLAVLNHHEAKQAPR